ncbi:GntR family transcriptional regulator [Ilyobacter sp.]|uniref:GntR family transcriptional regulator n=1 Tax=Ilyobacter sp. TaxID=3100343 RepID=UPI003569D209
MFLKIETKDKNENNRNYIYKTLRYNIMHLYIKPGELISETELCKYFNVSRTPIREAFIKLSEEKLIDIYPQRGSYVSRIDLKIVKEGIFMRKSLEKSILFESTKKISNDTLKELKKILAFQKTLAELNATSSEFFNLDNKFHETIFRECSMERIWEIIDNMNTHYNRLRFLDTTEKMNTIKIIEQHEKIIEIIEKKDITQIDSLVDQHLTNIMEKINFLAKKFPTYFTDI